MSVRTLELWKKQYLTTGGIRILTMEREGEKEVFKKFSFVDIFHLAIPGMYNF